MAHEPWDAIVVGVGAMGSAACWRLARRGARVLGLEQFTPGHDLGSSGGRTRLIRLAYFEHPDYVPLLRRSYALWDELDAATGRPVLARTGALYAGPADEALVAGSLASARAHALPHERLDGDEIRRRYPMFRLPEGFAGMFEPEGGYLLCEQAIIEMAGEAARRGAVIRDNEPVRSWSVDAGGVAVVTDRATHRGAKLVLAAGAWSSKVASDLGVSLAVTRQILGWVRPPDLEPFREGNLPCWAIDHGEGLLYGSPIHAEEPLLKVANHHRGAATDPDRLDRRVTSEDAEDFLPHLRRYLPSAVGPVARMKVCMYTNSDDGHFFLDHHPRCESVSVACGFSGHGFKFAPVVGEALADLALAGRTDLPIGFLAFARSRPTSG